jgi:hypothetical protein
MIDDRVLIACYLLQGLRGVPALALRRVVAALGRHGGSFRDAVTLTGIAGLAEFDACMEAAVVLGSAACLRACLRCRTQWVTGPVRPASCPRCSGALVRDLLATPESVIVDEAVGRGVARRVRATLPWHHSFPACGSSMIADRQPTPFEPR